MFTHKEILNILNSSNGQIFHVEYHTKDGEFRSHNAKLMMHKSFSAGHASKAMASSVEHIPDLFTCVDTDGKWKRIYLDNLISMKVGGKLYELKDIEEGVA